MLQCLEHFEGYNKQEEKRKTEGHTEKEKKNQK